MLHSNLDTPEATEIQKVVVVYETPAAREQATDLCLRLAGLKPESKNVHWCHSERLRDSNYADRHAVEAADADVIIFAGTGEGDFHPELKQWIDRWLARREREGAITGLFGDGRKPSGMASRKEIYLRHVALRAGMDYLSHFAVTPQRSIPNSLDNFSARAAHVSSVLDQILSQHFPPAPPMR